MKYNGMAYGAIVPIKCGNRLGTAFFIEANRLLTARHVVLEALRNDVPVNVMLRVGNRICSNVELLNNGDDLCDIAILTLPDYQHPTKLELLAKPADSDSRFFVAGFPSEIGSGSNLFDFEICNCSLVSGQEYDVIASPKELIPFSSYNGFSGSPIITVDGFVVGIITDQLSRVVGFSSIKNWIEAFRRNNLIVQDKWEYYDNTPYGYARSVKQVEEATRKAGDRYSPDVHIERKNLSDELSIFCSKKKLERLKAIFPSVERWYLDMCEKYTFINKDYNEGDYGHLYPCIYRLRECYNYRNKDEEYKDYNKIKSGDIDNLSQNLNQLNQLYKTSRDLLERKCAFIHGVAGSGKTHFLCHFAKHHELEYQTYLLFGNQFVQNEDLIQQIENLLKFPNGLQGLNVAMSDKNRYAVIIVDAINEGVGFPYWKNEIEPLAVRINSLNNIRIILSARVPNNDTSLEINQNWVNRDIGELENTEDAIDKYFEKYGVDTKYKNSSIYEFSNPLFLRVFCIAYGKIPIKKRDRISKLDLFLTYLNVRNKDVALIINEDPYKDVTSDYLVEIAERSLFDSLDGEVTRDRAREISYNIYPNHLWDQSLLFACLKETLLLEAVGKDWQTPCIDFEFDNLGDFLRAYAFLKTNKNEQQIDSWLTDRRNKIKEELSNKTTFVHFVGALLSIDDRKLNTFITKCLSGNDWDDVLYETLQYRGPYNIQIITKFIQEGNDKIIPFLIRNSDIYSLTEIEALHKNLIKMSMSERDLKWSSKVNDSYDWNGSETFMNMRFIQLEGELIAEDDKKKILVLLLWLLTSSYPELRAILIRHITDIFTDSPLLSKWTIELFALCNDPYVLQGLYCAIYGMTLRTRNADVVCEIADHVYKYNFEKVEIIPNDLLIRQWTMKIIERAANLNSSYDKWAIINPPFETKSNPFLTIDGLDTIDSNYFGDSHGSQLLYDSLVGFGDFNRYVIGANSYPSSRVFLNKDTQEPILLKDIVKMVSVRVKEFGWSDDLGAIDNGKYSSTRYDNETERLGKKYEWLAYYDIMGQLTDVCLLNRDHFSMTSLHLRSKNYPWYTGEYDSFDPSLKHVDSKILDFEILTQNSLVIDDKDASEWLNDDSILPDLNIEFDDNLERKWVFLYGYDSAKKEVDSLSKEYFLFINSAFIKKEDLDKYDEWAPSQNYYGRWMPEWRDAIDFLWNEYPWSDSFHDYYSLEEEWEKPRGGDCSIKFMLSYASQLQEDRKGFDDSKDFSSSACMPCPDIMEKLNLYTAERGIIRSAEDDSIVAFDSRLVGIKHSGIIILKDVLDNYLRLTNYILCYFVMGEKTINAKYTSLRIKELSSSMRYSLEEGMKILSPLRVVEEK